MQAFVWNDRFATGIESVDEQHRRLIELVNQIGDMLVAGDQWAESRLQEIFKQLADYARFHFQDEERVMREGGLDPQHLASHQQHHHQFTEQVISMWGARHGMQNPAQILHGFLSSWLTYHILGEDQVMARELRQIAAGPQAPLEPVADSAAPALLQALQSLYGVLSEQNRNLADANRQLETRVAERTEELNKAYAQVASDNENLSALLGKIDQAQTQLLQTEKMAAIGQLAAGVAHEINNPIAFVNSNFITLGNYVNELLRVIDAAADPAALELAAEIDLPFLREDIKALINESGDGLQRVRKIIADLKDFSHIDETLPQPTDLLAGLETTISVANHELKYKVDLVRELRPLPPVRCIGGQINQVLMNLLVNAAQSISDHGTVTLRSGVEGTNVWLEIEDNGSGMSDDVKRRMFEPFFTTKPIGSGTGLGMSLSYDIIHGHGGSFDVDSAPGKGTRIRLWLPIDGPRKGATDAPLPE